MQKRRISLRIKVTCLVLAVAVVIAFAASLVSYKVYASTMDRQYETQTMYLAKTAAAMLDRDDMQALTQDVMDRYHAVCGEDGQAPDFESFTEDDWDEYYAALAPSMELDSYQRLYAVLSEIRANNAAQSIYVCYMDEQTGKAVYILDASDPGDACVPGDCDDIEQGNLELMQQGVYDFPAYITNYEEYGWLCSASAGIYSEDGKVIANAYVDISMNDVMQDRHDFLTQLLLILVGATLVLIVLLVVISTRTVVQPINKLAAAADAFVSDKEKSIYGLSAIAQLRIHTGDEIENLASSIQKMEQDITNYIDNLAVVTAEKERISTELHVATQIQASMLPCIFPPFPDRSEFDIYASMNPAKEVGGDFYDFFMVDESHIAIVMADVSGKGVPAALFMVIGKTLIKDHTTPGRDLGEVFMEVNKLLCEGNGEELFITAFEGVLDLKTGQFNFVNAGHEMPFIRRKGQYTPEKIRAGFVLAGMDMTRYRMGTLQMEPGDAIFQYTDGVTEATNANNELYGMERLEAVLNKNADAAPDALLPAVKADIDAFVGDAPQFDDITMLCMEYKEKMK